MLNKGAGKIPATINYFWFGGAEKPYIVRKCIQSWKKNIPSAKIIEWNESNYDVEKNPFIKKAFHDKKWAFVSDYARIDVLNRNGGIYFDSDVLVLKDITSLLTDDFVASFQSEDLPFNPSAFGSVPHHPLLKKILRYYDSLNVDAPDFNFENYVNTDLISHILLTDYSCIPNNREQLLKDDIKLLPAEILCIPSKYSYTIHVMTSSWKNKSTFGKIKEAVRANIGSQRQAAMYAWLKDMIVRR